MPKPKVSKQIEDGSKGLTDLMREKLQVVADSLIKQIMVNYRKATASQKIHAIKGITPKGVLDYKDALKTALSVIALDAMTHAKSEVPKKKNVKLSEIPSESIQLAEFDKLPPDIQKKIKTQTDLLVGKQVGDLQKVVEFAYTTIEEETDSEESIAAELSDSAIGWLDGTALQAGAALTSSKIINSARNAFFFDDEVLDEVEAFEFVNGDPVSEICQDLAGTVFSKDDPDADSYFPPLHWNSVLGNTLITTDKGPVPIQDIQMKDQVLTHMNRFKPVTEVMSKFEDQEYYEIKLNNGLTICITGDHPVLTERRGWVTVDKIGFTDALVCIAVPGQTPTYSKVFNIKRRKLKASETLHNLAVLGDQSYIANGIVVHNCKSYISPILTGNLGDRKIESLAPSSKDLEDQIQFHEPLNNLD